MIEQQEAIALTTNINQARQGLGQYVSTDNMFAMQDDAEQFQALGRMFQKFTIEDFQAAIKLAYRKKQDDHKGGMEMTRNRLTMSDVRDQCHVIMKAKQSQEVDAMPRLAAPEMKFPTGDEFFNDYFPTMWANFKEYGSIAITPFWSKDIFPDQWHILEITKRLAAHPEFHEGRKDNARKMTLHEFHKMLNSEMKAKGISELYSFTQIDADYHTKEDRDTLNNRIEKHNLTKSSKLQFDAHEAYIRAKKMAAVMAYGYIMEELNWETQK